AKPHQMQPGAVPILCIGADRPAERRDRPITLADFLANFAEQEPGRWKIRRQLDSLFEQIGGGDQIALQLQITRKFETAVGDRVAGGQKQADGHGLYGSSRVRCAGQARARPLKMRQKQPIYPGCVRKTSWRRSRPACAASPAAFISIRCGRSSARSLPMAIPTTPVRAMAQCWPRRKLST